jgi:hypothetical protein
MHTIITCLLNIIIGIILISCTIYITDYKVLHNNKYLHILVNSKIYRTILLIIITILAIDMPRIGENYVLAILLSLSYLNASSIIKI